MRNTLLTTTALVLSAGIASADGHASISWGGTATAGMARQGLTKAVLTTETTKDIATLVEDYQLVQLAGLAIGTSNNVSGNDVVITVVNDAATAATLRTAVAAATKTIAAATASGNAGMGTMSANMKKITDILAFSAGTAVVKTGDFAAYSEVNATVTGSVVAGGVTLTAAMSVDAGEGYTFASDKTFDTAKAGAGVNLDNVTMDMGAMGIIKLDQNAIAHLVDAGDDDQADILYTNTFGTASLSFAADISEDKDPTAAKAVAAVLTRASTSGAAGQLTLAAGTAAVVADVQWSAKVSMPVGTGTVYAAIDEGKGNAFGASGAVSGITISFDSKLEALENQISASRDNTLGLAYTMGSVSTKATYNSIKDGDQWGISATYAADGTSISASTDEGSDWSISGSYLLGTGASVVGGVNYTEDAYLGLSFSF